MTIKPQVVEWLLEGPPWVVYRTRVDLLGQAEEEPEVRAARAAMLAAQPVTALLAELEAWPGTPLKSHKSAGHLLHKLVFIAELGLRTDDPAIRNLVHRIEAHRSPAGPFQVLVKIGTKYGGTGEAQFAWLLCDAPLVLYALSRFGLADDRSVQHAMQYLDGLVRDNGWPCAATSALGKFRGPGRKADPCLYATLLMLKLLAQYPTRRDTPSAHTGVDSLLNLWTQRKERRPYLFAMGSGFEKLKAPRIWYDLLHVTDVLTQFEWARGDPRLREMLALLRRKADEDGRFTAESVWRAWKDWVFAQKREPSRWITLLVYRILERVETG